MNHYDTLEVSPHASPEVIRAAYRSLMQRFHPDRNPGDPAAAARAASVASAYEILSDAQKRAGYDASLRAAARHEMPPWPPDDGPKAPYASHGRAASAAARSPGRPAASNGYGFKIGLWLLVIAVTALGIWWSKSPVARLDPGAELASIRRTIASETTAEAERRRLYARKLALLEEHPELQRAASAERSEDMASRTVALLANPLVVRVGDSPAGPAMELTVPAISLLVGSFDAPHLLDRIEKHRERLVEDLAIQLAREDPDKLARPVGEIRLKSVVRQSINASLDIKAAKDYPSTYFESPGRYGVVEVLLTDRFKLVQLGQSR